MAKNKQNTLANKPLDKEEVSAEILVRLHQLSLALPKLEDRSKPKVAKSYLGETLIRNGVFELSDGTTIKPKKRYVGPAHHPQVDHLRILIALHKSGGWENVELYQKQVISAFTNTEDGEKVEGQE